MEFLNRYKRAFIFLGMAVCVASIIFTLNPNYSPGVIVRSLTRVVTPLQTASTSVANWISLRLSLFWEINYIQQEILMLREQVGWLELENQRLLLAGEENRRLVELLHISERYGELPMVGARIIAHEHTGWRATFRIDQGTNHGLERNMPVLGPGGLVGIIQEVYPTSSVVRAIIDDGFVVAARTIRTEDEGTVWGDGTLMQQGLVRMDHISRYAHIMVGDELITSTISELFPPGILIGEVIDIQPTPDGLAQFAIVNPTADIFSLEHVLVITQTILGS
ncbi:MAG: rod shape-determining protein MreC [Turicibacter sp.]|nr:rod shape-determining protein MreC [Turicibacter sp.]